MERYNHQDIEKKWQQRWAADGLYATPDTVAGKENYYQLVEFPYPSGNLHVGHWYAFCGPDIHARYMRMTGHSVLFPVGFDAFGLPAENAAIKRGLNPRIWTEDNMAHMREQITSMGASFDRNREVVTCHPDYYRWTQWLFIQLFNAGLVHRRTTEANWCPSCKTVLANEQVVGGACERCSTTVEKKQMPQWQIDITKYADRLIDDLDALEWPEEIKQSQKNWIGRSNGAEIDFQLTTDSQQLTTVTVFTTRPDTLFGATYLVLAPEHPFVEKALAQCHSRMPVLAKAGNGNPGFEKVLDPRVIRQLADQDDKHEIANWEEVAAYIEKTKQKSDIERTAEGKEKTGVKLEGVNAINPATGEAIPVFIADYVLAHYGTGAIMAVPAHDERDFAFAKKFGLPVKEVVAPYVRLTGPCVPREDKETTQRRVVTALIKHPTEEQYWVMRWPDGHSKGFVGGGIEEGETPEEAIVREIREETGFQNFTVGQVVLPHLFGHGYKLRQDRNNHDHDTVFLVQLDDLFRVESEEDDGAHQGEWLTEDAVAKMLTLDHHQYMWQCHQEHSECFSDPGVLVNSGAFDGMTSEEAKKAITEKVGGRLTTTYKLRDWGISRQRYWGCPIPLIHCAHCAQQLTTDNQKLATNRGWFAVPDAELPVVLPEIDDYLPSEDGRSPLAKHPEWMVATCPSCGGPAERETDTMDTFMCSSWYFLRYADPHNTAAFASREKLERWMPIDFYSGGAEHTTMHLLYSRFFHKALYDLGLVPSAEPYAVRRNRGLILGPDGNKMSKSKGNVIDPDDIVRDLGADTLRIYLAFIGPYNETGNYPWNPQAIVGVRRFVERVWRLQTKVAGRKPEADGETVDRILHKALKAVTDSIAAFKLNTGVAALMGCLNDLEKAVILTPAQMRLFLTMLAPYAPHIAEELWVASGGEGSVHRQDWPAVDETLLTTETVTMAVQVGGKLRATVTVPADADEATVVAAAMADSNVQHYVGAATPRKTVVVPGRLINIVL